MKIKNWIKTPVPQRKGPTSIFHKKISDLENVKKLQKSTSSQYRGTPLEKSENCERFFEYLSILRAVLGEILFSALGWASIFWGKKPQKTRIWRLDFKGRNEIWVKKVQNSKFYFSGSENPTPFSYRISKVYFLGGGSLL